MIFDTYIYRNVMEPELEQAFDLYILLKKLAYKNLKH